MLIETYPQPSSYQVQEWARSKPHELNHKFLMRFLSMVFTCYLFDRGVIDRAYLQELRIHA